MESTLYILLWPGEIDRLVLLWNLLGHLMENMLLERVLQRLRFSLKTSRFVLFLVSRPRVILSAGNCSI